LSAGGKSVQILGGNQSDMVKISRYARKDVVGYRLPSPQAPAAAVARLLRADRWGVIQRARRRRGVQLECRPPQALRVPAMAILTNYAIPIALAAVGIVLLLGLWNMMRGGSANTSQLLMRWRVILQFVALCLVMAAIWLAGR
jgi:hypothetical protein